MNISKNIFRDYDIRGVYPEEIDAKVALVIGKTLGTTYSQENVKNVVVCRDDRKSSPELTDSLIEGLISTGINVTFIGISLTPIIHFLTYDDRFDAGIVVTASHNPVEFNGFRLDKKKAVTFYGQEIKNLYSIIEKGEFVSGKGTLKEENLSLDYLKYISDKFLIKRKIKTVIDCGNGAGSLIAPILFKEIGAQVIPTYCNLNSKFPHGVPDPENPLFLKHLAESVLKNKAEVGFGFDTDGDRFGVVDELGEAHSVDRVLLLFAKNIPSGKATKKVVFDVKCSQVLEEELPKLGLEPVIIRTGHPYFVENVAGDKALVGAEYSGHVYFGDRYFGYDDGIYAACRVLEIMDLTKRKLSDLMKEIPKRPDSPEIKLPCADADKFKVVDDIKAKLLKSTNFTNVRTLDGIRANVSEKSWFLVRTSNTSPYLSLRFEAESKKELKELAEGILQLIKQYKEIDPTNLERFIG
jgi:phosphomannomutase / phosphoglucomutase